MNRRNDVLKLFSTGFDEPKRWVDWYFNNVYNDDKALVSYCDDTPAACLMTDPYKLKLGPTTVDMAYISCCTTAPRFRGQGLMSRLLVDTLLESASKGYAVASLIPASESLYFFYDRLGFATVFYADEQRFTSLHKFIPDNSLVEVEPDYGIFSTLENLRNSTVLHSENDFVNIMADNRLDNGHVITLADSESHQAAAMLFATVHDDAIIVNDLLSTGFSARSAALALLRERVGQRMFIVRNPPSGDTMFLKSRGMLRIVNPMALLKSIAEANPETEQVIRLHDNIIQANNAIFIIHNGDVERTSSTIRKPTLDVSIETLAKIIFNSPEIGKIFSMPSYRPYMALMLD